MNYCEPQVVDTLGGRMHVRWDRGAAATPHGQLVFFAEFLGATGVFERWVLACPLAYRSGNAPLKRDVLGTLMLGLLAGHRRYAHITSLRGDAVAAQVLGMNKIVSDHAALQHVKDAAEQGKATDPWAGLLRYVSDKIAPTIGPFKPPNALPATAAWDTPAVGGGYPRAEASFKAAAARMSAVSAFLSSLSPSWKSIARLTLPSRLELKRPDGSASDAPLGKVIFTTFL